MRLKPHWLAGIASAALTALLGLVLHGSPLGQGLVHLSYDWLFAPRPDVDAPEAVVVFMDEESHEQLQQSYTAPWDRRLHARLIERLTAAGARAIVFDIVFSDAGPDPAADEHLARAIQGHGRVVLGADVVPAAYGRAEVAGYRIDPPLAKFSSAAGAVGSVEVRPSQDLIVREHWRGSADDLIPSLSWAAAQVARAQNPGETTTSAVERWVNYYGPPGTTAHVSFHRALAPGEVPDALFRDKVVFVGTRLLTKFSGERKDEYRTPYSYWRREQPFISGVEIQATLCLNLLRGDWLRRWPAGTERTVLVLCGIAAGLALVHVRSWAAAGLALLGAAGLAAAAYGGFAQQRLWFPWLIPVAAQLPFALLFALVFNSFRLYLENRLLEQTLARHLAPARVKQLLKRRELLRPGAEKTLLSIMFTDIADFTRMSEGMDSDELARLMNSYFEAAISCVHETEGCLVKLIGDAMFAIWNAPISQADHHERVLRTALLLKTRVVNFTVNGQATALRTRIGIHTGVADVGNFGSARRFDYTAIGENINLASRLEGLNKHLGTDILASRETLAAVDNGMVTRFVGHFRLKGFEKTVAVHELIGPRELAETTAAWREGFAEALARFQKRQWDAAEAAWRQTLQVRPGDGPSAFYLERLPEFRHQTLPPEWHGEIELKEK